MKARPLPVLLAYLLCAVVAQADINTGLALHYDFETDTGVNVFDQSGAGNNGTVNGATWTSLAAVGGGAMSFDGNDWISAGNVLDIGGSVPVISASVWAKIDPGSFRVSALIDNFQASAPYTGWAVRMVDGTLRGNTIATYPQDAQTIGAIPITDNEWHHIVSIHEVGVDFLRTTLYVNNQFEGAETWTGTPGSTINATELWLGQKSPDGSNPLTGVLDDARVYTRALTQGDVAELYALGVIPEPSTLAFSMLFLGLGILRRRLR